ncbi:conserved hypothetical protein [Candida dubliniensis CD36]|uniref:Uncharacterized protein n=1 Tax=Candida dubliniensis (strain CD36 / ATCC MYA-646 / CBS 7987 / NCPF 3949 / NRRL Y-17841) TaxID=573826 RepID=B9WC04_CANDC|nr:conserved hypothetical protein [Candida dubliniensis CD36]CAX43926.1 conserved hypothetical protein [Candida dubliniensis CD36]
MARPTIFPPKKDNNGTQLISRLNQLISITESLATLTSIQRQELVKLFRMTIDMIILRTNQLSTEFINKCTRLVNSYKNLIMAITSNEQQSTQGLFPRPQQLPQSHPQPSLSFPALSNLRTPGRSHISTPNLQIRKYGIFHDRVSNLSPSISTQSMFEVAANRRSKDINRMLLPDQDQKSCSDESEFEEDESQDLIYNGSSHSLSPGRSRLPSMFLSNRLSTPNLQVHLNLSQKNSQSQLRNNSFN